MTEEPKTPLTPAQKVLAARDANITSDQISFQVNMAPNRIIESLIPESVTNWAANKFGNALGPKRDITPTADNPDLKNTGRYLNK